MAFELWTDGSFDGKNGGYAVLVKVKRRGRGVICENGVKYKIVAMGRESGVSIIRMEGEAILAAINYCGTKGGVIYTDSEYWVKVINDWGLTWKIHDFKRAGGPLKNVDLVRKVFLAYRKVPVRVVWVKGHSGEAMNELADKWARVAREE